MKILPGLIFLLSFLYSCKNSLIGDPKNIRQYQKDSATISLIFSEAMQAPDSLDMYYSRAEKIAGSDDELQRLAHYHLSRNYVLTGRFSAADSIINEVLEKYPGDSLDQALGKFYNLKGSLLIYQSNQTESIQYFEKALKSFEKEGDIRNAAAIEFNIAQLFMGMLDYTKAYEYSMKAHKKLMALDDTLYLPLVKGMAAVSSAILGKISDAKTFAEEGLMLSEKFNHLQGNIFAQYALGEIAIQQENYEKAINHLIRSKEMALKANLFSVVLPNNAAMLKCYLLLKDYHRAALTGEEGLELAGKLKMSEIRYSLLKNTAHSFAGLGNHQKAYDYMAQAEHQFRQRSNEKNQQIIHELLIKYDDEKKTNQILMQQRDIARKNQWVVILAGIIFIGLVVLFFKRINNAQKRILLQQERQRDIMNALAVGEENERTRLADELHDGVASNLVALKLQLENVNPSGNPLQKSLDLLSHTQKELRYLAHRMAPVNFQAVSLPDVIKDFCQYCSTPSCKVSFYSNVENIEKDDTVKIMLLRAVQELIQNALKHAGATEITVQLLLSAKELSLIVRDNGCGMDSSDPQYLPGFESLKRRVGSFNGNMTIHSEKSKGTTVHIQL